MAITNQELIDQYSELHRTKRYGQTSSYFAPHVKACIVDLHAQTVLEYGCGRSTLSDYVESEMGVNWSKYDPAIKEHSTPPSTPSDLIVCTDVMEHIPEEDVDDVLAHIKSLSDCVFFNISTRPAKNVLPNGENAHCTVWNEEKWRDTIHRHFPSVTIAHIKPGDSCLLLTWESGAAHLIEEIEKLSILARQKSKKRLSTKIKKLFAGKQ